MIKLVMVFLTIWIASFFSTWFLGYIAYMFIDWKIEPIRLPIPNKEIRMCVLLSLPEALLWMALIYLVY